MHSVDFTMANLRIGAVNIGLREELQLSAAALQLFVDSCRTAFQLLFAAQNQQRKVGQSLCGP